MSRPTPAPARWPYPNHRTMEQVLRDEAEGCRCELVDELGDREDCYLLLRLAAEDQAA